MSSIIKVAPITSSIGARVTGVDLHSDLEPAVAEEIRDAFARYCVLVFHSPVPIGATEQTRLAEVFGTPQTLAPLQFLGDPPATELGAGSSVTVPDRAVAQKKSAHATGHDDYWTRPTNDGWHTDSSFAPWVPRAAVLRAELIPPVGGDTSFTSLCAAYDGLSPLMQEWLKPQKAIHAMQPYYKDSIDIGRYGPDAEERFDAEFPPREHPIVVEHPETGRPALFVNPAYTIRIVGLAPKENDAVLRFLFNHVSAAEYVYRHHWSDNDLVVWDELTALHRAPTDFAPHDRKVVRITTGRAFPTALTTTGA